ncbi:MAG: hypothetical protein ACTHME_05115 [Candidatus Nitrosocosmicus sp.]
MKEIESLKQHYYISPFKLGDKVFIISKEFREEFIKCIMCDGDKILKIQDKNMEIRCPECYGEGGKINYLLIEWILSCYRSVEGKYTISRINLDHSITDGIAWEYMCEETGIETGAIYRMNNIFLTKEEALAECEKRNSENERN